MQPTKFPLAVLGITEECRMILSHKIRIYPNKEQEVFLRKSCGVARFTYNWALEEWQKEYRNGNKPSAFKLNKKFNSVKKEKFPFVCEVNAVISLKSICNLEKSFKNFFNKFAKYPKFKKKSNHESFELTNQVFKISNNFILVYKIGKLKTAEKLRFEGKIMSGTVSRTADKWFLSVAVELNEDFTLPKTDKYVGVDLGVKDIAITSDGHKFANPQWIKKIGEKA